MFDLVIKNGTIVDGTGRRRFKANIGIKKDRIKSITNSNLAGKKEIKATDCYVTPGFIDILNHTDGYLTLLDNPTNDSLVQQGITTMICGNCGTSLAPLAPKKLLKEILKVPFYKRNIILAPSKGENLLKNVRRWTKTFGVNITWITFDEYLKEIKKKGISCNFGSLVGYNTCRRTIVGDEARDLTFDELKLFKKTMEDALSSGALGVSLGLGYSHGSFIKDKEIVNVLQVLKKGQKYCAIHLRDEGLKIKESLAEAFKLAKESDLTIEVSHFKLPLKEKWNQIDEILNSFDQAQKKGLDVNFDVYPYRRSWLPLYSYLPKWVSEGGKKKLLERLQDKSIKDKIVKGIKETGWKFDNFVVSFSPNNKFLVGKRIKDMAENQNLSIEETLIELLISNQGDLVCFSGTEFINKDNLKKEILSPHSIVSSDGVAYDLDFTRAGQLVHPRCFGAFPKFLKEYVGEGKLLSWEEAVKKITFGPAQKVRIKDRGEIKENSYADLNIIDPEDISDKSTYDNPFQYPVGIKEVIINGKVVVEKGNHSGVLSGEIIRG